MKHFFYLNTLILFLGLAIFNTQLNAQTTTAFRKNYDLALFDLPGNIIEGLTPATYVMAGTNLSFLPIYGTVTQLNDTGAINWSYRYSDASISFQLNDIKKDAGNNQYITCGGSESNSAVFMVLDAAGNVVISKRFSINEADGAWFNRVIKASDGGYVAVGYVTGYDPDGAGSEIYYAPITYIDNNGDSQTDYIASPLIVKLDASGNHVWHKVFRYYTAATKNPTTERIYNDASFTDVVEVSDGYAAVGSYDVNQHRSAQDSDGDDATPTDALILKTTTGGAITYHKQIDNPNSSTTQSFKNLAAVNTTSAGDIIAAGTDDLQELIQKHVGPGAFSNIFSRLFTYSQTTIGTCPFCIVTDDPCDVSQIYEVNGSTDLVTMAMYIKPLSFFANSIHRMNPTATSNIWAKRYDFNLASILPRGGLTSDGGYINMSMTTGIADFDYHVIKTDPNGDTPLSGCPATAFTPIPSAGPTTFADPYYNSWSGTPGSNSLTIIRSSISPALSYVCTKIICAAPPNPTASATSTTICAGFSTTINGAGSGSGATYNVYTSATGGTNLGSTPLVVSPSTTTTYYVEAVVSGCPSTTRDPITITVNPLPTVTASATSITICAGDPVTLTGGGATSYTWDNGVVDGVAFNPTTTTTYTVTGTDGNGCLNTAQITITVTAIPTVTANATSITICTGDPVTLTGSGATTYTWDNGVVDGVSFNPTTTTTYTVIGSTGSCSDTDQITVTVNPLPTVTASATSLTVCAGDPVTLTGSGATSYTWDNGVVDGVSFNPTTTTTYTVTGTDGNGCSNTDQITVTVNPLPTVTASATSITICAGDPVTLTGGGATSYTWDNGVVDGVAFNPTTTTTYTVTGTDGNGCLNTAQITVTVNPLPTVTANATNIIICTGDPVTLTGGGATSYTWDNGVVDGVAFNPTTTTTYTVTGTDGNGCLNTAQITITVTGIPTVTANATSITICTGDPVTLTGSGATTYTWTGGVVDGVPFNPTATATYTVTGSTGSCSDTDQITVTVNPLPTVTASATSLTVCAGDPVTLTGGGAASYTWDNGVVDGVSFNPTTTTTYTVTGTDGNGCSNTDQITITVNPLPTVTANATSITICTGDLVTLTGGGATSYTWDNGVVDGVAFNPTTTTTYTVTGTDGNGCSNTNQITVTVLAPPVAVISGASSICDGDVVSLTASGGGTYVWNTGDTTTVINVNPTGTTTYTLIATIGSCVDSTTFTVNVTPLPIIILTPSPDTTISLGESVDLIASGGTSYIWSPSTDLSCSTCANPTATPDITTTYCVFATNSGCTDTACVIVIVDINCGEVFVPTAFSPNGDGVNDCLKVFNNCIETMVFRVYARWGEVVFEATDVDQCWDGSFKGKDLNNAVFVYTLEATLITGEEVSLKGNVSLIR